MIKTVPKKLAMAENWETFEGLVRGAAGRDVELFCSPEGFLDGYCSTEDECDRDRLRDEFGQDLSNDSYPTRLKALAVEMSAHIIFGLSEKRGDRAYNAAVLVDPSGDVVGVYHKTHLQGHDHKYSPGEALPIFDTDLGRIGIMICADRRWPETARVLRVGGADIIMNPTYGMWGDANEGWMRTRSYENGVHICFTHPNVALITDPEGNVSGKLQSNIPDVLIHDVDISLNDARSHLNDRRPDLYGPLTE